MGGAFTYCDVIFHLSCLQLNKNFIYKIMAIYGSLWRDSAAFLCVVYNKSPYKKNERENL